MKQLFTTIILAALIASSCQKSSNDIAKSATSSGSVVTPAPPPTANFRISNAVNPTAVWEALKLNIDNSSKNAVSYLWDFGEGTTSTEKTPANFSFGTCGMTYTITLTVKNKDGQWATYSAPYTIYCSRGMGFGAHGEQ